MSLIMPQSSRKRARKEPAKAVTDTCQIILVDQGATDALGCTTYDGAVVTQPGKQSPVTYRVGDNVLVQTAATENVRRAARFKCFPIAEAPADMGAGFTSCSLGSTVGRWPGTAMDDDPMVSSPAATPYPSCYVI